MLCVHEVQSDDELKGLQAEWSVLLSQTVRATPFQSWEWVYPWWQKLRGGRLRVITVREEGRLLALLPLCEVGYAKLPIRRLVFMGAPGSDYNALLVVEGRESEAWHAILRYLQDQRRSWDLLDVIFVRPGSVMLSPAHQDLLQTTMLCRRCPQAVLPSTWDDFSAELTRKMRSNISRGRKQLQRDFDAVIETARPEQVEETMAAFFRLHAMRWQSRGVEGSLSTPVMMAWQHEVAQGFARQNWLRLHRIRIGNEIKAVLYTFRFGDETMFYNCGFDISLSRYSPGSVLLSHAIQTAILEGCRVIDFTRGDETYKYDWNVKEEYSYRIMMGSGTVRSRLAMYLGHIHNQVEQLGSVLRNWLWGRHSIRVRLSAKLSSLRARFVRRLPSGSAADSSAKQANAPDKQKQVASQQNPKRPRPDLEHRTAQSGHNDLGQRKQQQKQRGKASADTQGQKDAQRNDPGKVLRTEDATADHEHNHQQTDAAKH